MSGVDEGEGRDKRERETVKGGEGNIERKIIGIARSFSRIISTYNGGKY